MGILYVLNYVDRSALAATKVYGIMEDLGMSESQFATAIAILFGKQLTLTELLGEYYSNFNSRIYSLPNSLQPDHDQNHSPWTL